MRSVVRSFLLSWQTVASFCVNDDTPTSVQAMTTHRSFVSITVPIAGILVMILPGEAGATTSCRDQASGVAATDFEAELGDAAYPTPVRAVYPTAADTYPLVLFSHGAYSAGDMYDDLLCVWAAQGYVVLAPTHLDSTKRGTERYDPRVAVIWPTRVRELTALLDQAERGDLSLPAFEGKLDTERVAAVGHSLGALVAMALTGLSAIDAESGARVEHRDPRFDVFVSLAGPGELPFVPDDAWDRLTLPGLVLTGTKDVAMGDTGRSWTWRRRPFDLSPPGDRYLLVIDGGDHYLGGQVGRDDLPVVDPEGYQVESVNRAIAHFLNAYLRDDAKARLALTSGDWVGALPVEAEWTLK